MPFDSNGVFSLTPGYTAVAGQVIQPSQHNPPLEDISIGGLSLVLVRDGRAPMTGNLNMNGFKVTGLLNGTSPQDAVTKAQFDIGPAAKLDVLQPFATIASATTTDLGTVNSQNVIVTGTTTVTSFGTVAAGTFRRLRFSSPLTLTHNAVSLILPYGGANITVIGGETIEAVSLGGGNWVVTNYRPQLTGLLAVYEDQKSAGTSGGSNVAATWTTRVLNTEKYDPLSICSISSNAFTPTVNVIAEWSMPFNRVDSFQSRLFNVTDGVVTAWGQGGLTQNVGTDGNAMSTGISPVLAAGKTYRLEYFGTTSSTAGLGWPANAGGTEVYTILKLWRP